MNYEKKPINAITKPMGNDYLELENSEGMPGLVDSTLALNFLLNAKNGIRNCAFALTEIADPEARAEVRDMLNAQIDLHVQVSELMMNKSG
jgi:similar to spore coat protein